MVLVIKMAVVEVMALGLVELLGVIVTVVIVAVI